MGNNLLHAKLSAILAATCVWVSACDQRQGQPDNRNDHTQSSGPATTELPGLVYAKEACADCHAVLAGQTQSPDLKAPTFESIANRPGVSRMGLAALLRTSHRAMPNLIVESVRIDDLYAYLATLKK